MIKLIFLQIIFILILPSTKSTAEVEITLNFCEFGQHFYREMVFSLIGEFQFVYIEKLKEQYVSMKHRMKEITELIFDLRNVNLKKRNRIDHQWNFIGLLDSVEKQINKSHSFLDEMGLIVTDGKSAECAGKIVEGKYEKAAQLLTEIENNGLIYSIVTMVYKSFEQKVQYLACETLFGFTVHLNQRGMQLKAAAVYISLFSILIENQKYYSDCTLKLAEFGKIGTEKLKTIQIYAHQKEILLKRYRYIREGSPSIVRKIVEGNKNENHWCIYNRIHDAYLVTETAEVFTKHLTKFEANSKWILDYDSDELAYKIRNFRYYLQLSTARQTNSHQKEIVASNEDEDAFWTLIPLNENEMAIESFPLKDRLISGPDTDFFKRNNKRHAFAHSHDFAELPADGIDRWTLREC